MPVAGIPPPPLARTRPPPSAPPMLRTPPGFLHISPPSRAAPPPPFPATAAPTPRPPLHHAWREAPSRLLAPRRFPPSQVLLLISSERGQIYSFATPKLQPILVNDVSKGLIESCLAEVDPQHPDSQLEVRSPSDYYLITT